MKQLAKSIVAATLAATMTLPSTAAILSTVAEAPIASIVSSESSADDVTAEELTSAILRFKEVFGETDRYEKFSHSYGAYQNLKVFFLDWSSENESVSASITETGLITSYFYNQTRTSSGMIVPEISKNAALTAALGWVADITPEYLSYVSDRFADISYSRGAGRYSITLYANINGRRIDGASITLRISSDGTLLKFDCSAMPYHMLPAQDNGLRLIDEKVAANKLSEALPFEPVYRSFYSYNHETKRREAVVKLVYVPNNEYSNTLVNALTGDVLKQIYPERDILYGNGLYADSVPETEENMSSSDASSDMLTDVELDAIELQEHFKTTDELKNMLLELAVFDFDDAYELSSSDLYQIYDAYTGEERYVRTAVWKKTTEEEKNLRATLTCDAETGEIISFRRGNYNRYPINEWKNSSETLTEKAVAAFDLLSNYSEEYRANGNDYSKMNGSAVFSLDFDRWYCDIPVESDHVSMKLDPNTGAVLYYNIDRIDGELQSPTGALTADKAADAYFDTLGLTPYYIAASKLTESELTRVANNIDSTEKMVVPVYAMQDYCFVDAFTGQPVNYTYEEYQKKEKVYFDRNSYAADSDHPYGKAITLLFNMGYIQAADTFRPDDSITLNEFVDLAAGILGYVASDEENDLSLNGVKAAKIIVKALGYDEIASLKGIYKLPFENDGSIDEKDVGYMAIAWALGFFDDIGEAFDPAAVLTRGEAAIVMASYILKQNA